MVSADECVNKVRLTRRVGVFVLWLALAVAELTNGRDNRDALSFAFALVTQAFHPTADVKRPWTRLCGLLIQ